MALLEILNFILKIPCMLYFDTTQDFVLGQDSSLAKLSIFDGGIALQDDGLFVTPVLPYFSGYDDGGVQQFDYFYLSMGVFDDPDDSIEFLFNSSVVADFGENTIGFGIENDDDSSLYIYSEASANMRVISTDTARLHMESNSNIYTLSNEFLTFNLSSRDDTAPIITIDPNTNIGFFTDAPLSTVDFNGNILLQLYDQLLFSDEAKNRQFSIYKDFSDQLTFKSNDQAIQFRTLTDLPILSTSSNRFIAINETEISPTAHLYVSGNVMFTDYVFYNDNVSDWRIQPFHVSTLSDDDTNESLVESVHSILVDEVSGLDVDSTDDKEVTLRSPHIYSDLYDSDMTVISPSGMDMIEFKDIYGITINAIDTNNDSIVDALEFYNQFLDSVTVNGDLLINGDVTANQFHGEASLVTNIPFYWLLTGSDLHYSQVM